MLFTKNKIAHNTMNMAKERTLNAIKIDRAQKDNTIIEEPLQPYLEFMMDVTSEAILSNTTSDNTINIANKNSGLRFSITKLDDREYARDHYSVKLFNGNEIRFSGVVLNDNSLERNKWYFTEKYEDVVAVSDVSSFIEATAILYAKLSTEKSDTFNALIKWAWVCMDQKSAKFEFDKNSVIMRSHNHDSDTLTLNIGGIDVASCDVYTTEDGTAEVINEQIYHNIPEDVLIQLGKIIQSEAKMKFKELAITRVQNEQDKFYSSHAGIHYNEQAKLNDIFKAYI